MKLLYSRLRIMLLTFTFGLTAVFVLNGSLKPSNEISVNLPKINSSDEIIVVFPRYLEEIPWSGGAGGGKIYADYEKKIKLKSPK